MKLENVKIGQILKDKYGNKYVVKEIDVDYFMPVYLKCIKYVRSVRFAAAMNIIDKVGSTSWILKDGSKILSSDDYVGEFLKRHFRFRSDEKFEELKCIELKLDGEKNHFLFGNNAAIKQIDLTLRDLYVDDNKNYPTKDNTRLDDIIVDKNGTEYRVIARNNYDITVKYEREFVGIDGVVFNTCLTMCIPFPDDRYKNKFLTTKEFVFKNK